MAKGELSGKYGNGKGSEGYDLDVEITTDIKDGKTVYQLRRVDNNKVIKEWKNAKSPYNYAKKRHYNII